MTAIQERPATGRLHIQKETADPAVEWTVDDDASVATAKVAFDQAIKEGKLAYRANPGEAREAIHEFDPEAQAIVVTRPLAGG